MHAPTAIHQLTNTFENGVRRNLLKINTNSYLLPLANYDLSIKKIFCNHKLVSVIVYPTY